MVCPINLASEVPAQRTSHHSVGCEVLFAGDTGQRHCRSQPVGSQLAQWSWVFMGDHTGDGPGERRVLGREGVSTLEESPVSVSHQRPRPLRNTLEKVIDSRAVYGCFPGKKAGLPHVVVVREVTPQERCAPCADEGIGRVI